MSAGKVNALERHLRPVVLPAPHPGDASRLAAAEHVNFSWSG